MGERSKRVKWIVTDITQYNPSEKYDCWHDRAAFHFLTDKNEITQYVKTVNDCISKNGTLIIGTFSDKGPKKCSGIPIKQYTKNSLEQQFSDKFQKTACNLVDHKTPFNTVQNFIFCSFKKKN